MGCLTSVDFEASGWSLAGSRGSRRGFFAGFVRGVRSRGWFVRGRTSKVQRTYLFKVAALLQERRQARFADGRRQGLGHGRVGRGTPLGHEEESASARSEKGGRAKNLEYYPFE